MSLVLTRRVGETLIFQRAGDGAPQRLHIISIEGNTVRLAIDVADDVTVVREELLHPSQRPYRRRRRGDWPSLIAAGFMSAFAVMKIELMTFLHH